MAPRQSAATDADAEAGARRHSKTQEDFQRGELTIEYVDVTEILRLRLWVDG